MCYCPLCGLQLNENGEPIITLRHLPIGDTYTALDKCDDFYHPNDEGGLAWNDPEIGIIWPEVEGNYNGSADASGYRLRDGSPLILSDKDQKWMGLKDTFAFYRGEQL